MRILVLTNMYPTASEPWFGSFVADQITDLRSIGLDVSVIAFDGRVSRKSYYYAARELRAALVKKPVDVVHAHYGLTGVVAITQRRAPIVTTFHGSDVNVAWQRSISYGVARVTEPIFVSKYMQQKLRSHRGRVIPTAVDCELFRPEERLIARQELGWREERAYVLLPGARGNAMKGVRLFDEVISALRSSGEHVQPVSLEGYSRADAVRVMNAVDVVLMTSRSEGSPVAIKEALACRTPVVSVPVGDVAEVLRDLPVCAVKERDVKGLANSVRAALGGGRPAELRERALQYARPEIARKVRETYEDVAR